MKKPPPLQDDPADRLRPASVRADAPRSASAPIDAPRSASAPADAPAEPADPIQSSAIEGYTFLVLLVGITIAFAWILQPFFGAVFWGVILGVLFMPLFRWLLARTRQRTLSALLAVVALILIVVLPVLLITAALVREGTAVYQAIESGEISFAAYFDQVINAMPAWLSGLLDRFGLSDLRELQDRLISAMAQGSQLAARTIATQAVGIGQNALHFIVGLAIALYLAFFMFRDGDALVRRVSRAIPMDEKHKHELFEKFATVVRATVKGNLVVALVQGGLGGIAFAVLGIGGAVLWGVLMALLSLLPAVGAGLVWTPVAIYLLATGAIGKGVALIAYGVLVIGLVDNLLRPILVGKDTRMPDYLVLISTIGGLAVFGLNGFVIGPLIAAVFIAAWGIVATERSE